MSILNEKQQNDLKEQFKTKLENEVEISVFKKKDFIEEEDDVIKEFSSLTTSFVEELKSLSEKIKIKYFDLESDLAKKYNITTSPTVMIGENKGYKIIYNGAPLGHEASSFIQTLVMVSQEDVSMSRRSFELLEEVNKEGKIQVFVTLQCPYCPESVLLANKIAIVAKGKIAAECVEAQENIELANKYNVSSVPQQVINGETDSSTIGVQQEEDFVLNLLKYTTNNEKENETENKEEMKNDLTDKE